MAVVKFEITENGSLHYQMSPGFDNKMADEVLRVLKLAKDKGLLVHQQNEAASPYNPLQSASPRIAIKHQRPLM